MQILILVLNNMSKGDVWSLTVDVPAYTIWYLMARTIHDVTDEGVGNIKQHTLMGLMTFKLLAAHMQGHQGPKECFMLESFKGRFWKKKCQKDWR